MKINNDKYYTPIDLANYCWQKVMDIIGIDNITHIIEPSCGNGAFYHFDVKPDMGYDIETDCDYDNIYTADYLSINIDYKQGRLIIGNPPYGSKLHLAQMFYKKSIQIADYIAFILPISQLNNTNSMYEFDLIHSEDLGKKLYTDRQLHCCYNIYKRPDNGILNKKPTHKLKDVIIYRQDSKGYADRDFDLRMCYWGDGTAGKILKDDEHYSAEYKIKINNTEIKDDIIDVLSHFDWHTYLSCIAMRKIQQYHIIRVLKENISNIE